MWCPERIMSSTASSANTISFAIGLGHSYLQWIIPFCKWILAGSPHAILSSVFIAPYFFSCFLKRAHFFLSLALPLTVGLNCTCWTPSRYFWKLRSVPSKWNLNQALKLNWINSWFVLCRIIPLISLFPWFLIIWLDSSVKLYPALHWLTESFSLTPIAKFDCSLFLTSLAKTNIQVLVIKIIFLLPPFLSLSFHLQTYKHAHFYHPIENLFMLSLGISHAMI